MTRAEDLEAHDKRQREEIVRAAQAGEDLNEAMSRVKDETRPEYLRILASADNDLPVFPTRQPAPLQ